MGKYSCHLLSLVSLVALITGTYAGLNPGSCPKAPSDLVTTCDVRCSDDSDCSGSQKCCHWGCSVRCLTPTYSRFDCYVCNLNLCSRNTTNTKECQLLEEYNNTPMNNTEERRKIWNEMEKLGGCTEKVEGNCTACSKVQTTYRRILDRGSVRVDTVLSKICAKERPESDEDTCHKSGPRYATRHNCYCYGNLCNSAWALQKSVGILHIAGLALLSSLVYQLS